METNTQIEQKEMTRWKKSIANAQLAKQLYQQHGSCKEVSKILGVSAKRVSQIIKKADDYANRPSWLEGLDERLMQIMIRSGFTSADQIRAELHRIERYPDMGAVRHARLRAWLER